MSNRRIHKIVSRAMRGMPLEKRCAAHKAAHAHWEGNGFDNWKMIEADNILLNKGVDTYAMVKPSLQRNWIEQPD